MGSPVTTYGPAQTAITRTPIDFTSLPKGKMGQTLAEPSLMTMLTSLFSGRGLGPTGQTIYVDPSQPDMHRTILHEEVHAALDPLENSGVLAKLNADNPFYNEIASRMSPSDLGRYPNSEVAAYTVTRDPRLNTQYLNPDSDIQPSWIDGYINALSNGLKSLNPKLHANLLKIAAAAR